MEECLLILRGTRMIRLPTCGGEMIHLKIVPLRQPAGLNAPRREKPPLIPPLSPHRLGSTLQFLQVVPR